MSLRWAYDAPSRRSEMRSPQERETGRSWGPPSTLFADSAAKSAHVTVLMLNGVNLSQLQARDPQLYGTQSLQQLLSDLLVGHRNLDAFNSDHEGALVERIHKARTDGTGGIVINPGAWTHYSYGIRDALGLLTVPKAEVHLTHTLGREEFRRHSTITPVVDVTITGLGALGYRLALNMVLRLARERAQ